jgi:uncharacterized protein YabE (DUF348 family)
MDIRITLAIALLISLASVPALAGTWSGYLVDASCYKIRQQDTNPLNADDYANRDTSLMVELCRPSKKSKHFTVVEQNGLSFNLDAPGNAEAAQLIANNVEKTKKSDFIPVVVKGTKSGQTVKVDSICFAEGAKKSNTGK